MEEFKINLEKENFTLIRKNENRDERRIDSADLENFINLCISNNIDLSKYGMFLGTFLGHYCAHIGGLEYIYTPWLSRLEPDSYEVINIKKLEDSIKYIFKIFLEQEEIFNSINKL